VIGVSKKKVLAIVVTVIVAIIIGVTAYFLSMGGPSGIVKLTGVDLYIRPSDVSEVQTPIEIHLSVANSFPATVKVEGGNLAVLIGELRMGEVNIPEQDVKQGSATLVFKAILDNTLLDDFWYRHLSRGERSNVSIEGSVKVSTPVGGIELPVKASSLLETRLFPISQELNREYDAGILGKVVVKKMVVELIGVTPFETKLRSSIMVENGLKTTLFVKGLIFKIETGGGTNLCFGEQEKPKSIAPNEADTIVFDITVDNTKIPKLWVEHLRNEERTTINVMVWLKVDVAGRSIELFKEYPLTVSTELKTNIFKYK